MGEYDQAFKHLNNAKSIIDAMKWDNRDKIYNSFEIEFTEILGYIHMQDLENAYLGINNLKN